MAVERERSTRPASPVSIGGRWGGFLFLAWRQLRSRWLESLLVVLGLALGVAVLTAALSYLALAADLMRRFERFPEYRAITVMPQQADPTGLLLPDAPPALPLRRLEGEPAPLTVDLALRIRQEVQGVEYVLVGGGRRARGGPLLAVDGNPVSAPQGEEPSIAIAPTGADFFAARDYRVLAGELYTWEDVRSGRPVLAVDEGWAARYLPDVPLEQVPGHTVTAFGTTWSIAAVVRRSEDPLAGARFFGFRELVYGPWGAPDPSASEPLDAIEVLPRLDADRSAVRRELELLLTEVFGHDEMALRSVQELIPTGMRQATLAIAGLASLALLVASLNVLNLFLTRVVRRRRFLALSTALGASRRAVFGQTLLESLLLGLGGGAVGIALASAGVRVVEGLVLRGAPEGLIEGGLQVGLGSGLAGLAAALLASVLFGLYPALVAASQDPAEPLRE